MSYTRLKFMLLVACGQFLFRKEVVFIAVAISKISMYSKHNQSQKHFDRLQESIDAPYYILVFYCTPNKFGALKKKQ